MRASLMALASTSVAVGVFTAPVSADAIEDVINQTTIEEYHSYLRVLTGWDPLPGQPPRYLTNRYSYGDDIWLAAYWMRDHFESLGLVASLHEFNSSFGPNVIGELPGTTRPDDIYVFCGHYDTYHRADQNNAPGCDDNGSGTAAVMMAARILTQYQFEGTIRFIAFAGEEQWMVGSEAYAHMAYLAGDNIVGAINLDMFLHPSWDNYENDPDYDIDIGGNTPSRWLADLVAAQMAIYTPIDFEVHESDGFVSDQWGFWQWGYEAVGLIENTPEEIWGGSNDDYHQPTDDMGNPDYDWDFALHVIRGSMATLIDLAVRVGCAEDVNGDGEVAFDDLLLLLAVWGDCGGCPEDLDGNGVVDISDLLRLLSVWGPC